MIKTILKYVMAAFYVYGGVNHFLNPDFYLVIMPPYIPAHGMLVGLSGVAEIVLGLALLLSLTQRLAAWGIIAMLVAFLPVHVHMLVNAELFPDAPIVFLWIRFPLQALLILLAWWYTHPDPSSAEQNSPQKAPTGHLPSHSQRWDQT